MESIYYIEQGDWFVPTLNSLDTEIYLEQDVNDFTLIRHEKPTIVFDNTDTVTTTPEDSDDPKAKEALIKKMNENITGLDASQTCFLPYSTKATISAFFAFGIELYVAGVDATIALNLSGGIEMGDDRLFQIFGEFTLDLSIKWKLIFFGNGNFDWGLFGRKRTYTFDNVDHFVKWQTVTNAQMLWLFKYRLGMATTGCPPSVQLITGIRRREAGFMGLGAEYKGMGVSRLSIAYKDTFYRLNGHMKLGMAKDYSLMFRYKIAGKDDSNHGGYVNIELYWNQTRGNFNSDNDGDYFGFKIWFEYAYTSSGGSVKPINFDKKIEKNIEWLDKKKWFQKISNFLDKLDKRCIKALRGPNTEDLSTFQNKLQGVLSDDFKGIVADKDPSRKWLKQTNFTVLGGIGYHVHQVDDGGIFKTQYGRIVFKGQLAYSIQKQYIFYKIGKVAYGGSISFEINGGLFEHYDPFAILPEDRTESYIKTIYNGLSIDIEGKYDLYGYNNRICSAIYRFYHNLDWHREEFNRIIPSNTNVNQLMSIPSNYPACNEYLRKLYANRNINEYEHRRFDYLERNRLQKEKSEDKAWYTDPFKTKRIIITLEEKLVSVNGSWEIHVKSNLSDDRDIKELKLVELIEYLTHDLTTSLTLTYKKQNYSRVFIDNAKSDLDNDLSVDFKNAFSHIIQPKEKKGPNNADFSYLIYQFNQEIINVPYFYYTDQEIINYFDETLNRFKIVFKDDERIIRLREELEDNDDNEYTEQDIRRIFIKEYDSKFETYKNAMTGAYLLSFKEKAKEQQDKITPKTDNEAYYDWLGVDTYKGDASKITLSDSIMRGIQLNLLVGDFMNIIVNKVMEQMRV